MVWDVFLPLIRRPVLQRTPQKVKRIVRAIDKEAATAEVHEEGQQIKDPLAYGQGQAKTQQAQTEDKVEEVEEVKETVDKDGHLDIYI